MISKILHEEYEPRFTIKESDVDIREATTNHHYGLVVLFINPMLFEGPFLERWRHGVRQMRAT